MQGDPFLLGVDDHHVMNLRDAIAQRCGILDLEVDSLSSFRARLAEEREKYRAEKKIQQQESIAEKLGENCGTSASYKKGCRCLSCRAAIRVYNTASRAQRKANSP
jgi:hypothetical protein